MAESKLPYVPTYSNITKVLDKIKKAATPDRFTQDYLASTLAMKGGSPKAVIPFLKRVGFLNSDGTPTDLYKRFRNPAESGQVAAFALRVGYADLYEVNEQAHDLPDDALKGLLVQVTGLQRSSSTLRAMFGSFKALRDQASFEDELTQPGPETEDTAAAPRGLPRISSKAEGLTIGYTINLHLPPTSDVAVFNAIFRSLRENLLQEENPWAP